MRLFIKRCSLKYQVRFMTWQVSHRMKDKPESLVTARKALIKAKLEQQEAVELELFKDVVVPDMREKDKKKGGDKEEKMVKAFSTIKEVQDMFRYEDDYEILDRAIISRPPSFKFVVPSREVVTRLIIRASYYKKK